MINIPYYAIFATGHVVALYPSTPHVLGLKALEEALEKRVYTDFNARFCQNG